MVQASLGRGERRRCLVAGGVVEVERLCARACESSRLCVAGHCGIEQRLLVGCMDVVVAWWTGGGVACGG